MGFKRARSEEQKSVRIHQIVAATLELLETQSFDEITLKAIADQLDFSRINLYKYISTKEDIFLLIVAQDIETWVQDIFDLYAEYEQISIEDFSLLWSQTLTQHTRLVKSFSILNSVIEKNATLEALITFKQTMYQSIHKVIPLISKLIPGLTNHQAETFLYFQMQYVSGLYATTDCSDLQKKAMAMVGVPYFQIDFVKECSKIISFVLYGLVKENTLS